MGTKQKKRGKATSSEKPASRDSFSGSASPTEPYGLKPSENQRQKLLPKAISLGVLSGLLAVAFRYSLDLGENMRDEWLHLGHEQGA